MSELRDNQVCDERNILRQPVLVRFRAFSGFAVLAGSAVALFVLSSGAAMLALPSSWGPKALFAGGPLRRSFVASGI